MSNQLNIISSSDVMTWGRAHDQMPCFEPKFNLYLSLTKRIKDGAVVNSYSLIEFRGLDNCRKNPFYSY